LGDAYDLFFDSAERARTEESLKSRLRTGGGPFIIIAHSQGSMIAYDVLSRWNPAKDGDLEVPLFITLGSPLGLTEVKDRMKELTGQKRLMVPALVPMWMNFTDVWDYVAIDRKLAGDYIPRDRISDVRVDNPVRKNPHSGIGYLSTEPVRSAVMGAVCRSLFQKVAGFTVTRDLSRAMDRESEKRHPVLIELQDREPFEDDWLLRDGGKPKEKVNPTSETSGAKVRAWILERVKQDLAVNEQIPPGIKDVERAIEAHIDLEVLQSYVSAQLTRSEVEALASKMCGVAVYRLFKNNVKRRHLKNSVETIQANTAHLGYKARGGNICWAVRWFRPPDHDPVLYVALD
jgi:hypothetical protein